MKLQNHDTQNHITRRAFLFVLDKWHPSLPEMDLRSKLFKIFEECTTHSPHFIRSSGKQYFRMNRILLTLSFFCLIFTASAQVSGSPDRPEFQWITRIGLNALDQASGNHMVNSKSALGFQFGADVIWDPGWKIKAGLHYQYHEMFEFINSNSTLSKAESQDRYYNRLKISAGSLYDIFTVDFLTFGVGADLAYNLDFSKQSNTYYNHSLKLDYVSSLFHLYFNIRRVQIDLGLEGNLFASQKTLKPFQSKTYALTFGYIF